MKKFSRVLALGLMTTMIAGVFVGCSEKNTTPTPQTDGTQTEKPQDVAEVVTLKTVSMFGGTDPRAHQYQDAIANFMAANPNVTIEDSSATADEAWKSTIATDFAAGNEPDVLFYFSGVDAQSLVDSGKLVPVPEIQKVYPEYGANIIAGAYKAVAEEDGVPYCVPINGFYEGLFVNKDLFEASGLELPTDWAKFEAAVKGFADKGITPIAAALGHVPHYLIEHLILAEGGVAEHGNQDVEAVKDTWIKALSYFKTLNDMGAFPADTAVAQHEIETTLFAGKQAAMFVDGNWAIGQLTDVDSGNTILMPFPGTGNGKKEPSEIIAGFSSGFYITKKAWDNPAKQKAAVDFVMSVTTDDFIRESISLSGGGAPASNVGDIPGLSALGANGSKMAGEAKNSNMPIDSWLAKPAWEYLTSKIPGLATGAENPKAVVEQLILLNQ